MKHARSIAIIPRSLPTLTAVICLSILATAKAASQTYAATDQEQSQDPAAIIEAIDAENVTDLEFMDFVYEGMELSLGETGSITLSYLRSCRVEQIKGGVVRVGQSKSEVSSARPVEIIEVNCDGGGIVPTDRQSDVAGVAFRKADTIDETPVNIYSTAPIFAFSQPVDELVIERVGVGQEQPVTFPVNGKRLDLANHRVSLEAGGTYRAKAGDKSVLFKISPRATDVGRTFLERLIGI